jgi:hypothetical protein
VPCAAFFLCGAVLVARLLFVTIDMVCFHLEAPLGLIGVQRREALPTQCFSLSALVSWLLKRAEAEGSVTGRRRRSSGQAERRALTGSSASARPVA